MVLFKAPPVLPCVWVGPLGTISLVSALLALALGYYSLQLIRDGQYSCPGFLEPVPLLSLEQSILFIGGTDYFWYRFLLEYIFL